MKALTPNATLGVLGGGQLGRMFALAAHRLGYRVAVYSQEDTAPAGLTVDRYVRGEWHDLDSVERFARMVDVVTFEFENIPVAATEAAARHAPVRPTGELLHATQNRIREKRRLRSFDLPVAEFAEIHSPDDLDAARRVVPGEGMVKTAAWGYDGKGQRRVGDAGELEAAWQELGSHPAVVEALVPFVSEISVVGARGLNGEITLYEPFENRHVDQVLDSTLWPARISAETRDAAHEIVQTILTRFDVVGVLCVEMFETAGGELVVNEIAPRPHNSGHLTIDAHETSQFEQQVRAIAGLPLGSVAPVAPAAAMVNLLGDLWAGGEPDWSIALREPGLQLHLYGKQEARPGRKMGHMTLRGADAVELADRLECVRRMLSPT